MEVSDSVRYLGAFLHKTLLFKGHVSKKHQATMASLIKLRKIRQFLLQDACATLALGLIMFHLDFVNVLVQCSKTTIRPFQ